MCFVGFSIQIELAAVVGSVALFTHCQAIQLSAMMDFVVLNQSMQARIKNCFLARTRQNNLFLHSSHACMRAWVHRSGVVSVACRVVQAYLKHCCSLCEAAVKTKVCSKVRCKSPPTNLHSIIQGVRKPVYFFALMLRGPITSTVELIVQFTPS